MSRAGEFLEGMAEYGRGVLCLDSSGDELGGIKIQLKFNCHEKGLID